VTELLLSPVPASEEPPLGTRPPWAKLLETDGREQRRKLMRAVGNDFKMGSVRLIATEGGVGKLRKDFGKVRPQKILWVTS
jgi:hypothetical protein